jgi:hypothetical protein
VKVTIKSIPGEGSMKFAGQLVLPQEASLEWKDRVVSDIAISTVKALGQQGWYVVTRDKFYFGTQAGYDRFQEIVDRAV